MMKQQEITEKQIGHLYPTNLGRRYSQVSLGLKYQYLGLKKSIYDKKGKTFRQKDVLIQNRTSKVLFHFLLIHRSSRVAPNQSNIFYKKILTRDVETVRDWPFLADPYKKQFGQKDSIQINFSVLKGQEFIPYTNMGLTNIQVQIQYYLNSKPIQITITQQDGKFIGNIAYIESKAFVDVIPLLQPKFQNEKVEFYQYRAIQQIRKKENDTLRKYMKEKEKQEQEKNLFQNAQLLKGMNLGSKISFKVKPQMQALFKRRIMSLENPFYDPNPKESNDKYYPLHHRSSSLSYKKIQSQEKSKKKFKNRSEGCYCQGQFLGDCYLIAALDQFISQAPHALDEIFILQCNITDFVCIMINVDGCWIPIEIDKSLPTYQDGQEGEFKEFFFYSHKGEGDYTQLEQRYIQNAIFIERSLATIYRSYANLTCGDSLETFMAVANSNTKSYFIEKKLGQNQQLIKKMKQWNDNKQNSKKILITISSPSKQKISFKSQSNIVLKYLKNHKRGIVGFESHAYSFYGFDQITVDGVKFNIVRLRNSVDPMASDWMEIWRKQNSQIYNEWLKSRNDRKESNYQFLIQFNDLMELNMTASVCEYSRNNMYVSIPVCMEHHRASKIEINIAEKGEYYFSLHKKNARHHLQHLHRKKITCNDDEQNLKKDIKQFIKQYKYFKGMLILRKAGQSHPLLVQDNSFTNTPVTYLKCFLNPQKYELTVVFEDPNYNPDKQQNKQFLFISVLGKDIDSIQEMVIDKHQKQKYIEFLPQLKSVETYQMNNQSDHEFLITCKHKQECFIIQISAGLNHDLVSDLAMLKQQEEKQLIAFEIEKIDDQQFLENWKAPLISSEFIKFDICGNLSLMYLVKHPSAAFEKGMYKLKIKLGNTTFWKNTIRTVIAFDQMPIQDYEVKIIQRIPIKSQAN